MTIKPRPWGEAPHAQAVQRQPGPYSWRDMLPHDPSPRPALNFLQAKLTVGAPNDVYEQEADRVAEQVMSTPDAATHQAVQREDTEESAVQTKPLAATITPLVQRDMAPEEEEDPDAKALQGKLIQREAALPEEEEDPDAGALQGKLIQRKAAGFQAQPRLEQQLDSSKSGGSPLPDDVRAFMEPRFGADFSQVRVHTGNEAVQMNQDLNAQAFTHKQDLYFGAGKAPANDALTAHELTHVVQQTGGVHMLQLSSDDSSEESWWDRGINWAEGKISGGAHALAEQAEGIPVLEQVANAGAFVAEQGSQLTGGLLKGAGTMVGGIGNMIAHPVDTAMGLEAMAEHIPVMGAPLKAMHGVYDVAVNGKDPLETANHVLNPLQSLEDDATFYGNVAKGIAKPYQQEIQQGKYAEAVGRGVFDIGSIVLTAGAGAGAEGAATVGRGAAIAGEVADAARVAEGAAIAGEAADAARVAEGAAVASDATKAADVSDAAKVAAEVDEARQAASKVDEATNVSNASLDKNFTDPEMDSLLQGLDEGTYSTGPYAELPGQNPKTGEGLRSVVNKADEASNIAYQQKMKFKGIDGAPKVTDQGTVVRSGGKVEVRYHSANPTSPEGTYSRSNPTTQVNSINPKEYMLPDGTYKPFDLMTEAEKEAAHFK